MANPVCTAASLVTAATCYQRQSIQPHQQTALLLYAKVLELAAIGGTDYAATLTSTLLTDTVALVCAMTEDQRRAARVNIAFLNAATAGASVPETLAEKVAAIQCLVQKVEDDPAFADMIDLFLTCALGVHKAYVQ